MSLFLNSVFHSSKHNKSLFRLIHITQVNQLYSPTALGIDGYLQARKRTKDQFANFTDKFRSKIDGFVTDPKSMIFTEDLKNMVHMAEPTDLELLLNMIKKFNSQSTEFRFGSFVFGPVVMRMFHFLDAPSEAIKCFEDPSNSGFFDQLVSYHILLDLLYNHEMYDEMYKVFEVVKEKQLNMTKFPKYPVVLILAACYKQNTPQSLEYASNLWSEMTNVGNAPLRRACTFFAGLALKQGAPHIALESISAQKQHYVTVRNIKAMALADMGRLDEALRVLRSVLNIDIPEQKDKHTFFEETVEKVRNAVEKSSSKDIQKEFQNIVTAFEDRNLIDKQTLDQLINAEITIKKRDRLPFQQKRLPFGHRPKNRSTNLA
ncbi:pentatricopeptide repeat-containing protein 2, mitochondrial-like [Achroia grisella]|uniref:pentatricopeptide repeat-containing protein 2, mitochondrial-like n=1 Tax=Achroia grisella TaxID=688607 RepID=UPI0027D2F1E9|nr:pentatricopeptide repeat-containing protein 2, mitochondrial-like [Achroia grisella]